MKKLLLILIAQIHWPVKKSLENIWLKDTHTQYNKSFIRFIVDLRAISRNENIFNDISKWAECTDGNEAFNFFKDFSWRIYQRGSFSPEALGLYSLIFSLIKDLSIQNNDPMLYLVAKNPDKYNMWKKIFCVMCC